MTNLLVLLVCFVLGIALRQTGRLPPDSHKVLNAFIINVALPAVILNYVHALHADAGLIMPAAMPWVMFTCGLVFFAVLGRMAGWTHATTGGLILSGALANTSFVGLPMIEAFYGPAYLGIGVLADQLGTYLVLSTLGLMVAITCASTGRLTPGGIARKLAMFPPFGAVVLALLLSPVAYPDIVTAVLDRLGGTLTPLALISVGYQLRLGDMRGVVAPLTAGLVFKLVLAPLIIALFFVGGLHARGMVAQVTVFESAMGPMVGGAIVAMEHGLNGRLVGLMVGIGVPLSILTAALWSSALGGV